MITAHFFSLLDAKPVIFAPSAVKVTISNRQQIEWIQVETHVV